MKTILPVTLLCLLFLSISSWAQDNDRLSRKDLDSVNNTSPTRIPTEVDTSSGNGGIVDTTGTSYSTGVINRSGNKNRSARDLNNPSDRTAEPSKRPKRRAKKN